MTEPQPNPDTPLPPYPTGIVTEPFTLDDLVFIPHGTHGNMERAYSTAYSTAAVHTGDVLFDAVRTQWFARKHDARGELTDWQPMRCAAEARAFLVSKIRQ